MTTAEEGILLLCCQLGDSDSHPLTMAQFRDLGLRVRASKLTRDPLCELSVSDLMRLGYDANQSRRITGLLDRQPLLHAYLRQAEQQGMYPITRVSPTYPKRISARRTFSSTPVLFAKGDASLLEHKSVAVIGSRQLHPENEAFARSAGRLAAEEGMVLVSGNAIGADRTAQNACLEAGGSCIVFIADQLEDRPAHPRILYISEDGYDLPFFPARALHRNSLIHIQGDKTIAAQCTYGKGGTWEGCLDNLKHGWSPLFVFDDGSKGSQSLIEQGATAVKELLSIQTLQTPQLSIF